VDSPDKYASPVNDTLVVAKIGKPKQ
ncbi:MAG: hypothetical protein ACJA1X_001974, partial [Bermanella sp.]